MVMLRGAYAGLLAPGFRKVLFESYKELPTEGDKIVNMGKASSAFIEDYNMAGFTTLVEKTEGGSIKYEDIMPGLPKRYVWRTYGKGFRITQEFLEDDLYGIVGNKLSKALGRSARNNFEIVAHSVLNNSFDAAFNGFEPGVPLVSTLHTNIRGGTQANRPAADADLGLLPLQAAIEHFHGLKDEAGMGIVYAPWKLIYGVSNMWVADQLLLNSVKPGATNAEINLVGGSRTGLIGHLSHFIVDPDAWWVISRNHDMNYFDRRLPTFSHTDDFDTGDAKFKLTRRNGAGFGDWRGVYGSPGV
jgi:hypothetical protein